MWIVRNLLRGTLRFPGLDISIPPREEFDLDTIGRDRAEHSNQLLVAFEEGYLQHIQKDDVQAPAGSGSNGEEFESRFEEFKQEILAELRKTLAAQSGTPISDLDMEGLKAALGDMRESIVGDFKDMVDGLEMAQQKLDAERKRILESRSLSEAEVKARLAFLEEQEQELLKNFEEIGHKTEREGGDNDIMGKADLLSSI